MSRPSDLLALDGHAALAQTVCRVLLRRTAPTTARHRAPDVPIEWAAEVANARDWMRWASAPAMWVLTIALWLWVTYQSAVIELPPAVAAAATFTAGLAYAAGRSAGRRDA